MTDYFKLLNKSNQNTQQLLSGGSQSGGSTTVSSGGSGGTDYYSLLSTGKAPAPAPAPVETPNILNQAGTLINKGVSVVKNYFDTQKQTVQKYEKTPGTKGVFQNVFESTVVPVLDRQKVNIETKMQEPGVTNDFDAKQLEMINKFLEMTPDDRWKNKNVIKYFVNDIKTERNLKSAYTGVVSTVNSLMDGSAWLAGKTKNVKILNPVSTKLENVLNKGSDNLDAWLKVLAPENQTFAEKISTGAGSSLPFFAVGAGFGKGAQFLAKVSPAVAAWFAGSASGAVESMSEAGNVYDQNIKDGKSKEEANKAANKTFGANIVLNILTDRFGILSDDKVGLKKFIMSTSGEGIQEATQQVISNVNTGRPYDEGVFESGVIGSIIGAGMGGVGTISQDVKNGIQTGEEIQQEMSGGIVTDKDKVEPVNLPADIEPAVVEKIQNLNTQDVANPLTDETKTRVYQAVGTVADSNWVFKTPEALADYLNNGDPSATVRYIDVPKTDLVAHPERSADVYTIEPTEETVTEVRQKAKTKNITSIKQDLEIKGLLDAEGESIANVSTKIPAGEVSMTKGAIDVVKTEDGYLVLDGQHRAAEALAAGKTKIKSNILTAKEALIKYGDRWPQLESVLDIPVPKKRPASQIKDEKQVVKEKLEEKKTMAEGVAEVAKEKRTGLNTKDIGDLKKIYYRSQKFQEGDIETIRSSNTGKLLDRVIEDVQIKFPGMTEEEAFDYAMTLPTKSDEAVRRLPEIKNLKSRLSQIDAEYAEYVKKNGLAVGIRKKAIKNGLKMSFGSLPEYEMVNIDDQSTEALKLLVADKTYALDIALGKVDPPPGLLPESVFIAVENDALASGDVDTIRQLATESELVGEATVMGQRIRMLAERNPYSPTAAIDKVTKFRKSQVESKTGKTVSQLTKETVSDIKTEMAKAQPTKSDWSSFIDSIKCK